VAFDRTTAYAYLAIWVALVVARFAVPAQRPIES
jgi:hypothetical protein